MKYLVSPASLELRICIRLHQNVPLQGRILCLGDR